jgi:hypothetical protein
MNPTRLDRAFRTLGPGALASEKKSIKAGRELTFYSKTVQLQASSAVCMRFADCHVPSWSPNVKNYTTEVANPELDQIGGRFSTNRGKAGLLCCRSFEDRAVFVERCRDTLRDGHGLVIPVDDDIIIRWLGMISDGRRSDLDWAFTRAVDEVWVS